MSTQKVIKFGDFGKDLDDELSLLAAIGLERNGYIKVATIVANLAPALERARLAKGTVNRLGRWTIPVAIGKNFDGGKKQPYETAVDYMADFRELASPSAALDVLQQAEQDGGRVTVILESGLTDVMLLIAQHAALFKEVVESVVIMGGVKSFKVVTPLVTTDEVLLVKDAETPASVGYLVPDDAANNMFDAAAAQYVYRALQDLGIPMTILMRQAAYACQVPFALYGELADTGNAVGIALARRQADPIRNLWRSANAPAGSPQRGALPMSRDRAWFVTTFCAGTDPGIPGDGDIWPHVANFMLYDPMNTIAAVPSLRDEFFAPIEVTVKGVTHRVIGLSQSRHGVKSPDDLRDFVKGIMIEALVAGKSACDAEIARIKDQQRYQSECGISDPAPTYLDTAAFTP